MSSNEQLSVDVAIIGGGIVGASAALALRGMGQRVVLLERDRCGSRSSVVGGATETTSGRSRRSTTPRPT